MNCFTCAKPIAHIWLEYKALVEEYRLADLNELESDDQKKSPAFRALAKLHIGRDCCRRMFICQHDMYQKVR